MKRLNKLGFIATLLVSQAGFAETISDPCGGPSALLALVDRPTKSDSACAVPYRQAILELGYQYLNLTGGGISQNYPQAELRIGLPYRNELAVLAPNFNHQSVAPRKGENPIVMGLKHEIGYNEHWIGAIEGVVTLPTGGGGFGSDKYDPTVNAIIDYSFNSAWSLTLMLGVSSQSLPASVGSQRFTTVNPDLVLTWQMTDKLQTYGEIYGQSRTGPHQGAGFNADAGILYLLFPRFEVDAEFGHRISGQLGGFNQYYGVGMSVLMG